MRHLPLLLITAFLQCGCSAFPDILHQPQHHNPFPQLSRVAILPFYNQSAEPTVDGDLVALAYFNELQEIPGFEVMPVGVAKAGLLKFALQRAAAPEHGEEYQQLARFLGVDAIVVGSVTDYSPYYPPRLGMAIRWYAANPGFYPIPPGYGLPWGTSEEEFIPDSLVFEAEFALAQEQLKTQTPRHVPQETEMLDAGAPEELEPGATQEDDPEPREVIAAQQMTPLEMSPISENSTMPAESEGLAHRPDLAELPVPPPAMLPADWPDPRGFVPPPPSPGAPLSIPQPDPVLSLTRLYHGNDTAFTRRLANYFYFRDDARFGDWQAYLQRSDDFIRFCCHLHLTELLSSRGGVGKTRVVWRWPIGRYQR